MAEKKREPSATESAVLPADRTQRETYLTLISSQSDFTSMCALGKLVSKLVLHDDFVSIRRRWNNKTKNGQRKLTKKVISFRCKWKWDARTIDSLARIKNVMLVCSSHPRTTSSLNWGSVSDSIDFLRESKRSSHTQRLVTLIYISLSAAMLPFQSFNTNQKETSRHRLKLSLVLCTVVIHCDSDHKTTRTIQRKWESSQNQRQTIIMFIHWLHRRFDRVSFVYREFLAVNWASSM